MAQSVHTGGPVPAGLGGTLVYIHLAAGALEARHAEAGVAVLTGPAHGPVLARVRGAGAECGGPGVCGPTFEQTCA